MRQQDERRPLLRDERLRDPVSRAELERRWALARAIMDEAKIDAIVVQGAANNLGINGYFRWLTGASIIGAYVTTVLFHRHGAMTVISHGAFGGEMEMDPAGEEYPGAGRRLTSPSFPAIGYTAAYDAGLAAADLKHRGVRRVSLLGAFNMGYEFVHAMLAALGAGVETVPIVDAIDRAKAIKSDEEASFIRRAAAMQDRLISQAADVIKPGLREFELTAQMTLLATLAGSQTGFMLSSSGQPGQGGAPMFPRQTNLQGRCLRKGDIVLILPEDSGPGGYVTHIQRLFSLGPIPAEISDLHDAVVEAQDYTLNLLQPGAACSDVFAHYNDYMRARGFAPEQRLHAHGQGYDIVERPLIRSDESMTIEAGMNIGIHPAIMFKGVLVMCTDNYLISANGPEALHHTERRIFELPA